MNQSRNMNANQPICALLLLLLGAAPFQLRAQETEADRKLFEEIKAKAEKGDAQSQCALGEVFCLGVLGVAKDDAEAVKWIRKAAEQNHAEAQYNLGIRYDGGLGVAKDDVEMVKWYRKAANQNHARAQYNLGGRYVNGRGVAKDYVEGYKWWLLAAAQGDKDATKVVTILENKMSREQIAEGQKLARNFKPREMPSAGGDSSARGIAQSRPESSGTGFFITEDG